MENDTFVCMYCATEYPVLNAVPVLMTYPARKLFFWADTIEAEKRSVEYWREWLGSDARRIPVELIPRAGKMLDGMLTNLSLMEKHFALIDNYIRSHERTHDFSSWFFGYTPADGYIKMLPFFFQDWYASDDFTAVKNLISETLVEACGNPVEAIAVLGCGACGLLYHLADYARIAYGVDLGIPTLFAARQLINGQEMTFHLTDGDWSAVRLEKHKAKSNIQLIAADVATLPFGNRTLSVVVTQFLLDLIGDVESFAGEIGRVLKKDGIWINFSKPVAAPGDPPAMGKRTPEEMLPFLENLGFTGIICERNRLKQFSFKGIYGGGDVVDHECHFFVVRKLREIESNSNDIFVNYFLNGDRAIWDRIPRLVAGRQVSINSRKTFSTGDLDESSEIKVVGVSLPTMDSYAKVVEMVLSGVDGQRSLGNVYKQVEPTGAFRDEDEFIEFIHALAVSYYIIDISCS
ncbi:MAG: class I SAM-dependent methyltransferase [Methylococcales bacterium]